ncbi:MAG: hypothetical protein RLZ36_371 [Pseudomonadota bacterium]|jgi:transcriptional regulator with XRE-family HTH domain
MQEPKKPLAGRPKGTKSFDPAPALAFGKVVRSRRIEVGLSQEELANIASVERSHMGKIERGEHMPNLVLILRLADALKITAGELVNDAVDLIERAY